MAYPDALSARTPLTLSGRRSPPATDLSSSGTDQTTARANGKEVGVTPPRQVQAEIQNGASTRDGQDSPDLSERMLSHNDETSALLSSAPDQNRAAVSRAENYISSLPVPLKKAFRQEGLDAKTLAPLCEQINSADDGDITRACDALLRGIVACPQSGDLSHHRPHRVLMGGLAFVGSGINRPFGFSGLASLMPGSETTQQALSGVITAGSQVSDGAQGAFGSNRLRMEGGDSLSSWFSKAEWKRWADNGGWWTTSGYGLSLLSTGTLGGMAYLGAISLGLSWPVGLAFGLAKAFGSLPFYSIALSKYTDTVKGMDPEAEDLARRSVALLKNLLQTMGNDLTLKTDGLDRRISGYSETLGLKPGFTSSLASALCLYDPGAKCRNIVGEIRQAMTSAPKGELKEENLSLTSIFNYAQQRRSTWHWGWRAAGMAAATGLMMLTSWGEAATVANLLMSSFGPGICNSAGNVFHYMAWQGIMGLAMAGRSLGQAVILRDNLVAAATLAMKAYKALRGELQVNWRSLCDGKKLLLGALSMLFYGIGVVSSVCYTLSFAGAIYTNTTADVCLGMFLGLSYLLPVAGSLPMLVATLKMGKEIKTIGFAIGEALGNLRHCKRASEEKWYIRHQKNMSQDQSTAGMENIQGEDTAGDYDAPANAFADALANSDEETQLVQNHKTLAEVKARVSLAESFLRAHREENTEGDITPPVFAFEHIELEEAS